MMTQLTVLQYAEPLDFELAQKKTTLSRVYFLLERFPLTREDDMFLFQLYAKYFESPKYQESTIKRRRAEWCKKNKQQIPVNVRLQRHQQSREHLQNLQQSLQ